MTASWDSQVVLGAKPIPESFYIKTTILAVSRMTGLFRDPVWLIDLASTMRMLSGQGCHQR
jgi:hypothetical protein